MKPVINHPWNLPPDEAQKLQRELSSRVIKEKTFESLRLVAGVDVGFKGDEAIAAVVVLRYPQMEVVETATAVVPVEFPYIPGLLAFREGPAAVAALSKLRHEPELLIFDGQGLAHPRRMGIATHIGLIFDRSSIGCAKSRLFGTHHEPGPRKGSYVHLYDGDEVIGAVVRTRDNVSPVYVSIGHRIDLDSAIEIVLNCCKGYRLPEPIRLAHQLASGKKLMTKPHQARLF